MPQFAIRCKNLKAVWRLQAKRLLSRAVLWAAALCAAALAVSYFYCDTFYNWNEKSSVCFVSTRQTLSVEPLLILPALLLCAVLLLLIYGELFLLLIWRFSPAIGFLFCLILLLADLYFAGQGLRLLPIGLLRQGYLGWNFGFVLRLLLGGAVCFLLYFIGFTRIGKKEFL